MSSFSRSESSPIPFLERQPFLFGLTTDEALDYELQTIEELSSLKNDESSKIIFASQNKLM